MVEPTPLKILVFVNWDDELPNIWKNEIHVPNHKPDSDANCLHKIEMMLYDATSDMMLVNPFKSDL